jgi:hypothetical protein
MIRRLASGQFRLYSRKTDPKTGKRKNLGTFKSRAAAEAHERAVQYFKRHSLKGEPAELSPQGDAGSTNALFSLHEAAVASPTQRRTQKKPAGGVWRARGSRCWDRSERIGLTR